MAIANIIIMEIAAMIYNALNSILFFCPHNDNKSDGSHETDDQIRNNDLIPNTHDICFVFSNNTLSRIKNAVMEAPARKITSVISVFFVGMKKLTTVDANNIFERSAK